MPLSLRLALRFVFSPKQGSFSSYASWLAIGGLAIGIAALMLTASIIHGFQQVISEKLSSFEGQGRVQHILGNSIDLTDPTLDSLIQRSSNTIVPFVRGVCMVRSGSKAEGVLVEGVQSLPKSISNHDFEHIHEGEIVMGRGLANGLNIKKGDRVFIQVFSSGHSFSNTPRIRPMVVKDIFYSGLQEYDKTLAYTNLKDARDLFGFKTDAATGLIVNGTELSPFITEMNYPYYFETWRERHALLFEWITLQRWPAYIMFGLIALVGIINLLAAINMIILEKSGQIGILMAQGTPIPVLKRIFMFQGGFIGFMGGIIGGLLSTVIIVLQFKFEILSIPAEIYFMDQIPFSFDFSAFGIILTLVFFFSILASWWPTKTLTRMNPAAVLRYE